MRAVAQIDRSRKWKQVALSASSAAILFAIGVPQVASAQTASGVVNTYTQVTSVGGSSVGVSSTAGFAAGDTVLIIQMQGATVDRTNSANHGNIQNYGSAGTFEYAEIQSVAAGSITFTGALTNSYSAAGAVQLVRVATYADVAVTGTVTAPDWNGATGGVVAIDAKGTLDLQANVDVSTAGFRGGALAATGGYNCGFGSSSYTGSVTVRVGNKGEGITANVASHAAYRGHQANGGGGGNPIDAGGGGGGNYGAGGLGGRELRLCNRNYGGLGGQALDYSGRDVFYLGGGAGSGSEVSQAANGGDIAGGGIILIRALTINGSGGSLVSRGGNAVQDDANGADGGGAGGAIGIYANTATGSAITTNVDGGDGGDEANPFYAHGTGGGGGGGVVAIAGAISCASVSWSADEGEAGVSADGTSRGDPNWGASDGAPGTCLSNYAIPALELDVDLVLTKTNTPGVNGEVDQANDTVTSGANTTYTIRVTNVGPDDADGAVVTDAAGAGLACSSTAPVTITGDGVPAGSFTFADLSGGGITLGTLSNGQTAVLTYSCQVN